MGYHASCDHSICFHKKVGRGSYHGNQRNLADVYEHKFHVGCYRRISNSLEMTTNVSEGARLVIAREEEEDVKRKTFIFNGEGHTLGNALRSIIMKNPSVIFCGYTIPHPSDNKMHLRIETNDQPAKEVLKLGLKQLQELTDHVLKTFEVQYSCFFYLLSFTSNHLIIHFYRGRSMITNQIKWFIKSNTQTFFNRRNTSSSGHDISAACKELPILSRRNCLWKWLIQSPLDLSVGCFEKKPF